MILIIVVSIVVLITLSNEYYSGINSIKNSNSQFVIVVGVVAVIVLVIVETIVVLGTIVDVTVSS